jgi:hypothetical protein
MAKKKGRKGKKGNATNEVEDISPKAGKRLTSDLISPNLKWASIMQMEDDSSTKANTSVARARNISFDETITVKTISTIDGQSTLCGFELETISEADVSISPGKYTDGNLDGEKNSEETDATFGQTCPSCQATLVYGAYATLNSCKHVICCDCLCIILGRRSFTADILCPQCNKYCEGHTTSRGISISYPVPLERNVYEDPHPVKDPCRFWFKQQSHDERKGKAMIFLLYPNLDKKGKMNASSLTAFVRPNEGCCTVQDEEILIRILLQLHSIVFPKKKIIYEERSSNKVLSPNELVNLAIKDDHLCLRLLYSLATGRVLDEKERSILSERKKKNHQSDFLATFAAKELLARCLENQERKNWQIPSSLQLTIGDILFSFGVQEQVIDLLCQFRISASYSTLRRANAIECAGLLSSKPMVTPWDLVVWCYDNLGFTRKGREASKDQWTVLTATIVNKAALQKIGFYSDNPNNRISRDGQTLEEFICKCKEKGECYKEKIVGVKKNDIRVLTFYTLCHIETAMKLAFPCITSCQEMIRTKKYASTTRIPVNLGIDVHPRKHYNDNGEKIPFYPRRFVPGMADAPDYAIRRTVCSQLGDEATNPTMLTLNNMVVDIPLHADISKDETIYRYLDLFLEARKEQLHDMEELNANQEPPVANIMIPVAGDGQPVNTISTESLKIFVLF